MHIDVDDPGSEGRCSSTVFVWWDGSSISGIKADAAESRRQGELLLRQGVHTFYVQAVFNAPLSLEEFTSLVMETGMRVKKL
ncbi:hypothetical protein [Thermoflexus hugenholtzii]